MKELTVEQFVEQEPSMENVYGILVEGGRFYLLGRMMAKDTEPILVSPSSKENEINMGGLYYGIEFERLVMSLEGYGKMQYVYRRENGRLVDKHDEVFANAYGKFVSVISDRSSAKVVMTTEEGLSKSYRDMPNGRYVLVLENS